MFDFVKALEMLPPLPLDPSKEDIVQRRKTLESIGKHAENFKKRLRAEADLLESICDHPEKYHHSDGGGCRTCGWSY